MRSYLQSDVFEVYNRGNAVTNRIRLCCSKINDSTIMNEIIDPTFTTMLRAYKESVVRNVVNAARHRRILLVRPPVNKDGDFRLPEILPYVKVKLKGDDKIVIDISRYSTPQYDPGDESKIIGYDVDIPRLYIAMVCGYISLELCGPNSVLPIEAAKHLSFFWARYFMQVLQRMGFLTGDRERFRALMYFTIRFFLSYYLEMPQAAVDSISMMYLDGTKGNLISYMEEKIEALNLRPNESFTQFSQMLYNNEVTGIRSQKGRVNDINETAFLQRYITMYSKNAIIGLWSADYFLAILMGAYRKTNMVFDRAFEDVLKEMGKNMPRLMDAFYKEL